MNKLEVGLKKEIGKKVERNDLADRYGSGGLPVFATPGMIALMEGAACMLAKQEPYCLDTVGIDINVRHTKACLEGAYVTAEAELTKIDGKRLYFNIKAYGPGGEIGNAEHVRYIIDADKFMARLNEELGH